MLFDKLDHFIDGNGTAVDMDDDCDVPKLLQQQMNMSDRDSPRNILEQTVKFFAKQAYSTILVSNRDMSMDEFEDIKSQKNNFENEEDREVLEDKLTAVGIFGL